MQFGRFIRDQVLDIAFDYPLTEVQGTFDMPTAPLIIFAHIDQARVAVRADAIASVGDGHFFDPALRVVH